MGLLSGVRVFFMGTPEFAVPSLVALSESGCQITGVASQPDRPRGRGRKLLPCAVKSKALELGLDVFQPVRANSPDFLNLLRDLQPDFLVVAAYGQILSQELLDIAKIMPINVHGSLLPQYRGAAPIQWAIINGEKTTGITIMQMDAGMDTGPILRQCPLSIEDHETFGSLYKRMANLGATCLTETLSAIQTDQLKPIPQPENGVTYAPPIKPELYKIDWQLPAMRIANIIRALDPKPGAYTMYNDNRLRLYSAFHIPESKAPDADPGTLIDTQKDHISIAAGDGQLVGIRELQWPGKKRMGVDAFLRGRPLPKGSIFS